ncbi:MAG: hypothetical protein EOO21_00500 [Comamonadaceae bacterium]|nr:MAG: hypothetical protein EOO21_00500 [Comamonadaceae bacterium]
MRTLHLHADTAIRSARRGPVLVLVLALLLAQALGLMHRTLHGGQWRTAPVTAVHGKVQDQGQAQADKRAHAHGWVGALFAGHESDADCRLFDPLNHDGPATVATLRLPLLLSSFFLATAAGDFVARWAALFDARGPPHSR